MSQSRFYLLQGAGRHCTVARGDHEWQFGTKADAMRFIASRGHEYYWLPDQIKPHRILKRYRTQSGG